MHHPIIPDLVNACGQVAKQHGFDLQQHYKQMLLIGTEVAEAIQSLGELQMPPEVKDLVDQYLVISNKVEEARVSKLEWKEKSEIKDRANLEEELADIIIRVFSYCHGNNIDIEQAIIKKIVINQNRPHKHGKGF